MIRWNGWTTDRVRHWEYEAESAYELYSILCLNEVISYLDLDLDNETFNALSYVDTSGYLDSMRESLEELYVVELDYSAEGFDILYSELSNSFDVLSFLKGLPDSVLLEGISMCKSNAYYQEYEIID